MGFLIRLTKKVSYRIHTVLTGGRPPRDNGIQFANRAQDRRDGRHLFDRICARYGIEHRRTQPDHPWTSGQVGAAANAAAVNRTLKETTVRRYLYECHAELRDFLQAYDFAKRPKALWGLTPYEFIYSEWERSPGWLVRDPTHDTLGLYT